MAALITTSRQLLDLVAEAVARKSGLLLCDSDVRTIIKGGPLAGAAPVLTGIRQRIRVRAEFVDDLVRVVRAGIGNLPDARSGAAIRARALISISESGLGPGEALPILEEFQERALKTGDKRISGPDLVDEIVRRTSLPGWAAQEFVEGIATTLDRDFSLLARFESAAWDGTTPLRDLFRTEVPSTDPEAYLDQKFLDYLVANEDRLDRLHWRNFEHLVCRSLPTPWLRCNAGPRHEGRRR